MAEPDTTIDITPSPRILRTLGEIPFQPWQCIAELIDNSVDAFSRAEQEAIDLPIKRIIVSYSRENVPSGDRTLEVVDTGPGMELPTLQDCVRAGYSNNDPINNLGLFGMGFNIATARLGEKTLFLSATTESEDWVGVEIDFARLVHSRSFDAPVIHLPKSSASEHGARVIVSKLNPGISDQLVKEKSQIIRFLEDVYSPLLEGTDIEITVQGKLLTARPHCIWSSSRFISRKGTAIPAVIEIDETLEDALFDINRNNYLSPIEVEEAQQYELENGGLPDGVIVRSKRIHGWLGVQRYAHPDDFGIDFVRNGRKIMVRSKLLFVYDNPLTGTAELEYPVELSGTVGGRIVGEIHVDHLPPTYQKNDFDRSDLSWYEMVGILRGDGPILPKKRTAMGFSNPNDSPLDRLINAYRRTDPGTKNLAAPNTQAREWAVKFRNGEPDYISDEKWFNAAREADRTRADADAATATDVDTGASPTDDVEQYLGSGDHVEGLQEETPPVTLEGEAEQVTGDQMDPLEDLKSRSTRIESYSGDYFYQGCPSAFNVDVWEVGLGAIRKDGESLPCLLFKDGNHCDYFYDSRHSFLMDFPVSFRELLLLQLAERFKVRDSLEDIAKVFTSLVRTTMSDVMIDQGRMQERAQEFFDIVRQAAIERLSVREQEAIDCIYESAGEVEETASVLINSPYLLGLFQEKSTGCIAALGVVPAKTTLRLIDRFPDEFFDAKFFKTPYLGISLEDINSTERLRSEAKDRIISYLKDAIWLLEQNVMLAFRHGRKDELLRASHSLNFLFEELEE